MIDTPVSKGEKCGKRHAIDIEKGNLVMTAGIPYYYFFGGGGGSVKYARNTMWLGSALS